MPQLGAPFSPPTARPTTKAVGTQLHHLHLVQRAFLGVWRGEPADLPARDAFEDAAAVCRWGRAGHADLANVLAKLEPAHLASEPEVPWAAEIAAHLDRQPVPATLGETLHQVVLHSAHHRAQVWPPVAPARCRAAAERLHRRGMGRQAGGRLAAVARCAT